jgi:hypothetical protein
VIAVDPDLQALKLAIDCGATTPSAADTASVEWHA